MRDDYQRISKRYTSHIVEYETGLSTYDIALISLAKKCKRSKFAKEADSGELLAA
tara:strand:+ start:2262 stop:2426 length:165 start_codon:yes stop_codon:yes gene_type:complete